MTEDQIKHMVNRFLNWKLPENFNPDAGISFKATFNENTAYPMKHEPSGTNLFDAVQAEAMIRYMIDGMPAVDGVERLVKERDEAISLARQWKDEAERLRHAHRADAPDLLAALIQCVHIIERHTFQDCDDARAAIAKATPPA
ncbi:hypothetical protein NKH72_21700 [Mesorhizobium sp. M0955]|uniref:hypothetical protein n=1 Tax=Mesorhizobium sp. M0955 TaxID=2957033 RepID=UPI00333AB671